MAIRDFLLPEFDREMASTRKTLERIPEDKLVWKPHDKSMPLGRLAGHLAELSGWAADIVNKNSFDIAPAEGRTDRPAVAASRQQNLEFFDNNVAAGRAALAGASDEQLMQSWSLLKAGTPIFTMPRITVLRGMVMNHMIHHRAQLGVYLRLNNVPVPSIYGPSADEDAF